MEISSLNANYFDVYALDDVSTDNLIINNRDDGDEPIAVNQTNGIEPTATAIAIAPIEPESIQLQELQRNIVSEYENLRDGNISQEDFQSTLEELGVQSSQNTTTPREVGEASVVDLTSSLIESVKGNVKDGSEVALSEYADIMDLVNKETQTPKVNDQLQAYTQNLRN